MAAAATEQNPISANEQQERSFAGEITDGEKVAADDHNMGQSLSWSIWPLRENPFRSAAVVLCLALVVWAIASWFGTEWIMPVAFILIFMLAGFFFPTYYHMDSESISARGLISRKKRLWSGLSKYHPSKNGVHLIPEGRPSRMGNFRGIYLPYGDRQEKMLRFIEEKLSREQ